MKIFQMLNCTFPNQVGGAESSARELRVGLGGRGYEVNVITLRSRNTLPNVDADTLALPLFNIYDPWRAGEGRSLFAKIIWKVIDWFNVITLVRVALLFAKDKPDLLLTHNLKGFSVAPWLAAKVLGVPVVHVLHDYYLICSTCALGVAGERRCATQCMPCKAYSLPKYITKNCVSQFVGVSEFVMRKHKEFLSIPDERCNVINNVRAQSTAMTPVDEVGSHDKLRIGFIGRLEAAKGIAVFLDACRRLGDRMEWIVAGVAPDAGYLDALKRDLPSDAVRWLGHVRPADFYGEVDCVVVASLWDEPFPAVAYEPQIFGRVVVASDVGGIGEIVEDGDTGFLFPAGDVESLVNILDRLDKDRELAKSVADRGFHASTRFVDSSRMLDQYEDVIRAALGHV